MLPSLNISLSLNQNANTAFYFQNKENAESDTIKQIRQPETVKQHSYDLRMLHNQEHFKETIDKLLNQTTKNQRSISCATQLSNKHKSDRIRNYESTNQEEFERIIGNISFDNRFTSHTPISTQVRGRNAPINMGTFDIAKNASPNAKGQTYKRKCSGKGRPPKSQLEKPDIMHVSQEKCKNPFCMKKRAEMNRMIESLTKMNEELRNKVQSMEIHSVNEKLAEVARDNEDLMGLITEYSSQCTNIKAEYEKLESELITTIDEKEKLAMTTDLDLSRNKMKINLLEETLTKRNKDYDSLEKKYKVSIETIDKHKYKIKCLEDELKIRDLKIKYTADLEN